LVSIECTNRKIKKPSDGDGQCGFFLVETKPIGICRSANSANSGSNGGGPVKKLAEKFSRQRRTAVVKERKDCSNKGCLKNAEAESPKIGLLARLL